MKTIIIDDELSGRETLQQLILRHLPELNIVALPDSIESGIQSIQQHQPDLLFLDVELRRGTGFDLLERLDQRDFEVIFVTAYDQYALDAFRVSALDYLLKPINVEKLKTAVYKAKEYIRLKDQEDRIRFLLDQLKGQSEKPERIVLPTTNGFRMVPIKEIVRAESESNYTNFHLEDGTRLMVSRTLKEFENTLLQGGFYRIHRRHIVNMDRVTRYIKGKGGEVEMSDGNFLPVSRDRKEDFIRILTGND